VPPTCRPPGPPLRGGTGAAGSIRHGGGGMYSMLYLVAAVAVIFIVLRLLGLS
jgi:hypothetical protein